MKFIVIKSNLYEGVSAIERVGGDNPNLPILRYGLLEAKDNKIKLTATNLEIAISFFVSGKTIEDGMATAPLGAFAGMISNLQNERLNIEKKQKNTIEIKTDNYEATLQGLSPEDFPIIPKIKNTKLFFEIGGAALKESLSQVVPAAQFSELRPELAAVLVVFSIDSIRFVATDSFRLAEKTIYQGSFSTNHTEPFRLLVPLKTTHELIKTIKDTDVVRVHHDENQVLFKTERFELVSRLIEGSFPDYEHLVPKKFDLDATINREEFLAALKLVGVFGSRVSEVRLRAPKNNKNIEVVSSDQALGDNKYLLPAKTNGETKEVGFNWRYLSDGLRVIKTEDVLLGVNEENKPALLRPSGDASFFYIVMPILRA